MTAWPTLHQVHNAVSSLLLPDWSIQIFFLQISFFLLVGLYLPVLLGYFCNPHIIVELRWTVRTELEYRDRAIVHWLSYNRNAQPCPHQSSLNEFYFLIFYLIDVKMEDSSFMIYGFIYFFIIWRDFNWIYKVYLKVLTLFLGNIKENPNKFVEICFWHGLFNISRVFEGLFYRPNFITLEVTVSRGLMITFRMFLWNGKHFL